MTTSSASAALASPNGVAQTRLVYIEHTDCYGVVYNSNYVRFLATAREAALCRLAGEDGSSLLRHSTAVLQKCRLASPARLGDTLTLRSWLVARDERCLLWRQTVESPRSAKPHAAVDVLTCWLEESGAVAPLPAVFATLPLPPLPPGTDWSGALPVLQPIAEPTRVVTQVELCEEELGGCAWGRRCATEADVLRWFERNRTDAIGGGAGLAGLQASGTLVVVTAIERLRLGAALCCAASGVVTIRSAVRLMRRGFILFSQEGLCGEDLLASAEVTCACIDAQTMSLAPVPPALLMRLADTTY